MRGQPIAGKCFNRFDTKVTVIQRSPQVLKDSEEDAGRAIEEAFRAEGIIVHPGTRLLDTCRKGTRKVVTFERDGQPCEVEVEEIFFGLGRTPNTAEELAAKVNPGR